MTLVLCAVLNISSVPAQASNPVVVDRVVAIVNDEIITLSDLQRESAKNFGGTVDDRTVLDEMINRKLQLTAAKRAGLDPSEKELNDNIADIMKRNNLDSRQFEAALMREGMTLEQYRAELKDQIMLRRMIDRYVRTGIAVDDAEIRAYYERNSKDFALPEEIRVRHILLKVPEKASPSQVAAVREKAGRIYERARSGEDFPRLVREVSESETASRDGGDMGFLQRGHALPEIEQAARSLKPGEIAGPLQCEAGFHIIRLEEVRTPLKPLAAVRDEIANQIYQQKIENSYRTWLQTLRSESHIEMRL
jgi:peptidyl-prolyl cis-trans isomerase SurA